MQIRHQILFTVGHLDAVETWRCWRFLSVSFLASSLLFHSPAINTRLVWHSARHFLAYLTMFCSLCWDLFGCAQACASSVRISPLRMETLHLAVDVCGGQHITGALFEMNLYKWGNSGLPGHASGDHWQLACHQDTALVASDLCNQSPS